MKDKKSCKTKTDSVAEFVASVIEFNLNRKGDDVNPSKIFNSKIFSRFFLKKSKLLV